MAERNAFSLLAFPLIAIFIFSFQNCGPSVQTANLSSSSLGELSLGNPVPFEMTESDTGKAVFEGEQIIVNEQYRARIGGTRIPDGAVVTWSATAAPGGGTVILHKGATKTETAFICESAGLIYLSVKVESSGVTYNSREFSLQCD